MKRYECVTMPRFELSKIKIILKAKPPTIDEEFCIGAASIHDEYIDRNLYTDVTFLSSIYALRGLLHHSHSKRRRKTHLYYKFLLSLQLW